MTIDDLDWTKLGRGLRESVLDAHGGELVDVHFAYSFLVENPGAFLDGGDPEWPLEMPQEPNIELIAAYCGNAPENGFTLSNNDQIQVQQALNAIAMAGINAEDTHGVLESIAHELTKRLDKLEGR